MALSEKAKVRMSVAFAVAVASGVFLNIPFERKFTGAYTGHEVGGGFLSAAIDRSLPLNKIELRSGATSRIFDVSAEGFRLKVINDAMSARDIISYSYAPLLAMMPAIDVAKTDDANLRTPLQVGGQYTATYTTTAWQALFGKGVPEASIKLTPTT